MTRQWKRITGRALACVIIVIPFVPQAPAHAATAGGSCTKAGAKTKSGTVALVCTRVSGRLVWRRANVGGAAEQPSAGSSSVSWAWVHDRSVWAPSGTPPKCAYPIIPAGSLLDLGSAVSMVQPGQTRGQFQAARGHSLVQLRAVRVRSSHHGAIRRCRDEGLALHD